MSDINKIILIVLDSLGVGELPDADKYNDVGSNTLKHIFESMDNDYILENLGRLGIYNIIASPHVKYNPHDIIGNYGKMATLSPAKDTTAGHWELAGLVLDKPFPTYPNGFPKEIIDDFEKKIGCKILGNCTASGTEIIQRLGDEHIRTGYPIVYTSADSVFQIAAHEEPGKFGGLKRLHEICQIARDMLVGEHSVGRVIARPFITENGKYIRTPNRRDYSLSPIGKTILNKIVNVGGNVTAIGKITDIFNEQGISVSYHSKGNSSGIQYTIKSIAEPKVYVKEGPTIILGNDTDLSRKHLIFTNLVDFDMLWGHRRDVNAYAQGLKFFDRQLPNIMDVMSENDLLIITADHGCDPTYTKHTDHTREYVPLLVYGKSLKQNVNLGTRKTLADVAQTIADIFELTSMKNGKSFKDDIL